MSHSPTLVFLAFFATVSSANATPGDIGCKAKIGNAAVEVVIARDHFDQPPVYIEVLKNRKSVAKFARVSVFPGRNDDGSTDPNTTVFEASKDAEIILVRMYHSARQEPEVSVDMIIDSAGLRTADERMTCDF